MTLNTCLKIFWVFSVLPSKNKPRPLPSTYFPSQYSVIIIHPTQKEKNKPLFTPPPKYFKHLISSNVQILSQFKISRPARTVLSELYATVCINEEYYNLEAREFFLVQSIQTSSDINKTFIYKEHQWCCAHWIKQLWHVADQSPPSNAKLTVN